MELKWQMSFFKAEIKRFYKQAKKNFTSMVTTTTWTSDEWKKETLEKQKAEIEEKLKKINL